MSEKKKMNVAFAAIDSYIESHIVKPTETLNNGRNMVEWGAGNCYPEYLLSLYDETPTLQAIINGNVDYISGDDVLLREGLTLNAKGETAREMVRLCALDKELFGGYALQVIRAIDGTIAEIYHLDMRYIRMNKEANVFYYSEKWGKSRTSDVVKYPAFMPNIDWAALDDEQRLENASSILFVKDVNKKTYPTPKYSAAVKACEIERCIGEYHINSINNNFSGSVIFNLNDGVPDDPQKEEIEKDFNEKFCGHDNGGRVMLSFNSDKDHAVTITEPRILDFSSRYDALQKYSRQQLFTSFRANPNLFGIPTENLGFSSEEYESAFALYNKTQIQPIQDTIISSFERIYGEGVIEIKPFTLQSNTKNV